VDPRSGSVALESVMNGVAFGLEYDGQTHVLRIAGAEISLDTANVIIVDNVDGHRAASFVRAVLQVVRRHDALQALIPDHYGALN
jgi:hypothetical protein